MVPLSTPPSLLQVTLSEGPLIPLDESIHESAENDEVGKTAKLSLSSPEAGKSHIQHRGR